MVKRKLKLTKLSPHKRTAHERDIQSHSEASWAETQNYKQQELIKKSERDGGIKKAVEMAEKALKKGFSIQDIVDITELTREEVLLIKDRIVM